MKLKDRIITLILSTTIVLTPTVSTFATTELGNSSDAYFDGTPIALDVQMQSENIINPEESLDFEEAGEPIEKSNRYYYKIEKTGSYKSFPLTITKAQAASYNLFRQAIIEGLTIGLGKIASWAETLVEVVANDFATSYYGTAKAKAGTYTGHTYKVTKYKIDSLTGKKTKMYDGVRTTIPLGGVNCTKTNWYR